MEKIPVRLLVVCSSLLCGSWQHEGGASLRRPPAQASFASVAPVAAQVSVARAPFDSVEAELPRETSSTVAPEVTQASTIASPQGDSIAEASFPHKETEGKPGGNIGTKGNGDDHEVGCRRSCSHAGVFRPDPADDAPLPFQRAPFLRSRSGRGLLPLENDHAHEPPPCEQLPGRRAKGVRQGVFARCHGGFRTGGRRLVVRPAPEELRGKPQGYGSNRHRPQLERASRRPGNPGPRVHLGAALPAILGFGWQRRHRRMRRLGRQNSRLDGHGPIEVRDDARRRPASRALSFDASYTGFGASLDASLEKRLGSHWSVRAGAFSSCTRFPKSRTSAKRTGASLVPAAQDPQPLVPSAPIFSYGIVLGIGVGF